MFEVPGSKPGNSNFFFHQCFLRALFFLPPHEAVTHLLLSDLFSQVAGHDLKSLIQFSNLSVPDLCYPLMTLVDYLGYRLVAMSLLPIDNDTLEFGSANAVRLPSNTFLFLLDRTDSVSRDV